MRTLPQGGDDKPLRHWRYRYCLVSHGSAPPPTVHHVWGIVDAVIDDVPCTGAYGWTYFDDPPETGGSLHLRCEDDTVLGARTTVASIEAPPDSRTWRFTVNLEDGFYISPNGGSAPTP